MGAALAAGAVESEALPPPLTPRGAALRKLRALREQRDSFAGKVAEAEARPVGKRSAAAEDALHLAKQGARTAGRIVEAAEVEYFYLFGERPPDEIRTCRECGEPGGLADFPVRTDTGRPRPECRDCRNVRQRGTYQRHGAQRRAEQKARRDQRDPEERREYAREYYRRNRDRLRPMYTAHARESRKRRKAEQVAAE